MKRISLGDRGHFGWAVRSSAVRLALFLSHATISNLIAAVINLTATVVCTLTANKRTTNPKRPKIRFRPFPNSFDFY